MRRGRSKRDGVREQRWQPPRGPFPAVVVHADLAVDLARGPAPSRRA